MRYIGDFGEKTAEKYLLRHGYKIVEKNFTIRGGEIDLIAKDGDTLVFVEVKSRKTDAFGSPGEFVSKDKQRHIIFAARQYIHRHNLYDMPCRFDVVEIIGQVDSAGKWKVNNVSVIKDAFSY